MECQTACIGTDDCNIFTFDQGNNFCVLFYNCTNIDDARCSDCYTGQKECLICQESGECEGNYVGGSYVSTVEDCEMECFDDSECQWYTYDMNVDYCFLTSDCLPKNASSPSVFGQKFCYQDNNNGGNPSNNINSLVL